MFLEDDHCIAKSAVRIASFHRLERTQEADEVSALCKGQRPE